MTRLRRILIIGMGIIILIGILLGVYFLFFSGGDSDTPDATDTTFGTSDGEYTGTSGSDSGEAPLGELPGQAGEEFAPRFIKITDGPVSFGVAAFTATTAEAAASTTSYDTEVRYIERASGNVYAYRLHERSLSRISNRTLPGVVEASWLSDGSLVYARFLSDNEETAETVETYALPVEDTDGGYFLEPGLSTVAVKGTSTIATLLPSTNGSIATVASVDGSTIRTAFSSPLSALRLSFAGNDFLTYTKASAQIGGYVYLVDRATGSFERLAGPLRGLTAIASPSGAYVLYTYISGSTLRTELLDVVGRTSTPIPLGTLSEKCVFESDEKEIYCAVPRAFIAGSTIPDDWYQGVISFSDRIWQINLESRLATLILDPETTAGVAIDAVHLAIDPRADALVFINRKDGSLWAYDL